MSGDTADSTPVADTATPVADTVTPIRAAIEALMGSPHWDAAYRSNLESLLHLRRAIMYGASPVSDDQIRYVAAAMSTPTVKLCEDLDAMRARCAQLEAELGATGCCGRCRSGDDDQEWMDK